MGNRNFNQLVQSLLQNMLRQNILSQEEAGRMGYLREQQEGQRKYLGEQQAGTKALENQRTAGDERLLGIRHGQALEEEGTKNKNAADRLKQAYIQDLSKLPPVSQMQAQIFKARETGASPEEIAPLEENLKSFVKDHMTSAYKAISGELTPEDTGKLLTMGDEMSRLLIGQGGASMRQKEEILRVQEPRQKIDRRELAVKEGNLARQGKIEIPTLKYIEDAMKHIQEQGVTPAKGTLSPSEGLKAPSTLSKENYGQMLRHLQKLRVKVMKGTELSDVELDWIAKAYDATTADREGVLGPGEVRPQMPDISGGFGNVRKMMGMPSPLPSQPAAAQAPALDEKTISSLMEQIKTKTGITDSSRLRSLAVEYLQTQK